MATIKLLQFKELNKQARTYLYSSNECPAVNVQYLVSYCLPNVLE